jgi:spore coat polysaccharide biosynthesis protein SpsF
MERDWTVKESERLSNFMKNSISRNEQEIFWSEQYAEDYIKKNAKFDAILGVQAWEKMLASTSGITSLLECGCNIGRNIDSLDRLLPSASKSIIEISKPAFDFVSSRHALSQKFNGSILESSLEGSFDLVYTMGVLIHINPDELLANLQKAYNYSNKYLLFGEYFNRTPIMLDYQGEKNRLFKRDFGKLVIENFPVKLLDYGFLWGHIYDSAGFDDVTWWMFEKK